MPGFAIISVQTESSPAAPLPSTLTKNSTISAFTSEGGACDYTVHPEGIVLSNPPRRFSQDDTFRMAGYTNYWRVAEIC